MKRKTILIGLTAAVLVLSGCGPSAKKHTLAERRQIIDTMADQSLEHLYSQRPAARQEVAEAAGYAVFSNTGVHVIFFGGGGGYGVVVDEATGRKTYMKVGSGGVGLGLGAKDYRQIVIFHSRLALLKFVGSGWELGGQADATAKTVKTGKAAGTEETIHDDITTYIITETGLSLQASVVSSRYWVDEDLNQPTF